jgi:hypothetical protein
VQDQIKIGDSLDFDYEGKNFFGKLENMKKVGKVMVYIVDGRAFDHNLMNILRIVR